MVASPARLGCFSGACGGSRSLGFTLIELLVALVVVAVAFAAASRACAAMLLNIERQDDAFLSSLCADNALVGLRLSRRLADIGSTDLACVQGGRQYVARLYVRASAGADMRQIQVRVLRDGGAVFTLSASQVRGQTSVKKP